MLSWFFLFPGTFFLLSYLQPSTFWYWWMILCVIHWQIFTHSMGNLVAKRGFHCYRLISPVKSIHHTTPLVFHASQAHYHTCHSKIAHTLDEGSESSSRVHTPLYMCINNRACGGHQSLSGLSSEYVSHVIHFKCMRCSFFLLSGSKT